MSEAADFSVVVAAMAAGDFDSASRLARDTLTRQWSPEVEHALALCEHQLGDVDCSVTRLETLLERHPSRTRWQEDLAALLAARDRWEDVHARLSALVNDLSARGMTLWLASAVATGRANDALRVVLNTPHRSWTDDLGCVVEFSRVCLAAGYLQAAEDAARWCVEQSPDAHRAREVLAIALHRGQDRELALPHWRALVEAQPEHGRRHLVLSVSLSQVGCHQESRRARLDALQRPLSPADRSAAHYLSLFDERETGASIKATCEAAFTGLSRASCGRRRQSGPLRVGVLSAEFERPPATYFILPILRNLDRGTCHVFLYNSCDTYLGRPSCAHERDVHRPIADCSDDDVLLLMEADGIDVLLDLSGHFPGNRLGVMARRAAAIQATFPNYPSTTGCPNLDYFFTDVWNSPPGTEPQYTEALYRLPSGCLRFEPPPAPAIAPRPPSGPVTFGLFQRAIKYSDSLWDMVAGTLQTVADSRLLVHSSDLAWDVPGSGLLTRVRALLEARSIAPERVEFVGRRDLRNHLRVVGSVDIALDSYPYRGRADHHHGVPVDGGPRHIEARRYPREPRIWSVTVTRRARRARERRLARLHCGSRNAGSRPRGAHAAARQPQEQSHRCRTHRRPRALSRDGGRIPSMGRKRVALNCLARPRQDS